VTFRPFRPYALTSGGHRQTVLGYWLRRPMHWRRPTEDLVVDAGNSVKLLLRASWQPGPREARPALVLIHGLGGWDGAGYVLCTAEVAYRQGWHVVRMNMRGAGDSVQLCPRLYHAGLEGDLVAALQATARLTPEIAVAGFSLGASLALLAAGRSRSALPSGLLGVVAISPPLDLAACASALQRQLNRPYQRFFLRGLADAYRRHQRLAPEHYQPNRERGLQTLREFDERITSHYGGFRDAADYYARSSAGPHLAAITHATLLLAAADDPMIPAESLTRWPRSDAVRLELLPTGGHVGFVAPTKAPRLFWAAERALAFLEGLRSEAAS
jgi:uncharacterized protein